MLVYMYIASLGRGTNRPNALIDAVHPAPPGPLTRLPRDKVALESFQAALELSPAAIGLRLSVAESLRAKERHAEAIEAYRGCIQLDPKALKPANDLGLYLHGLGRHREAVAVFLAALEALAPVRWLRWFTLPPNERLPGDGRWRPMRPSPCCASTLGWPIKAAGNSRVPYVPTVRSPQSHNTSLGEPEPEPEPEPELSRPPPPSRASRRPTRNWPWSMMPRGGRGLPLRPPPHGVSPAVVSGSTRLQRRRGSGVSRHPPRPAHSGFGWVSLWKRSRARHVLP